MKKRKGFKYVTCLPINEEFVGMIEFEDCIIIASTKCVYKLMDKDAGHLETIRIEVKDEANDR